MSQENIKVEPSVIALMKMGKNYPDTRWAAYQNVDLGSPEVGHLKFMAVGSHNTFKEAPERMPDTDKQINWRYMHVGWVDLNTCEVIPI